MAKFYLLFLFQFHLTAMYAQTITSAQTGNWSDGNTWVGGVVPGSANDVIIAASHTVTLNMSGITVNSLTVNATGVFTISASNTLTVSQNVSNSGTINNSGNAGLRIGNNLTNNGTMTGAVNSILSVGGTQLQNNGSLQTSFLYFATPSLGVSNTLQTVSGSGAFTIVNIQLQKTGGATVTLNVPLIVTNLNMGGGSGYLVIGNNDFQTNGIVAGSATKYVITNGTAKVIFAGGASSKTFHIGTASSYTPVTVSGGNTSTHTLAVRVSNTFTVPPGSSAVVNREWNIEDITGGANVDLGFQWPGSDEGAGFNRSTCAIARYDGSNWQPITTYGTASGTNPYTRTVTAVTTFSSFLVGSSGSFPITSAQTGNWNAASTWQGGIVPSAATDNVIISSGHTINYDLANTTINSLSMNNGAVLQLGTGNILTTNSNVSNAGIITFNNNSSLRVGGDLTNSANINVAIGATNTVLSVAGNINNSAGTITAESLYFSSTSLGANSIPQAINSNNSLLNFSNVFLFNNGANITFNVPLSFSNLNFNGTTGNLILQNSTLTISGTIAGASSGKYIQTNGTGSLFRTGTAAPKVFPVGTTTSYTPLTISNGNVATHNFSVRVSNAFTNAPFNNAVVNREWNITDNTGGANVDLSFQWNTLDEDPSFNKAMSYVGHYDGTQWVAVSSPSAPTGSDPYTKTITGITSFSPFGIGSNGALGVNTPLPVHLISFVAVKNNGHVKLEWAVENEINFSHYEIERSTDGRNYEQISVVTGKGGNETNNYSVHDHLPGGMYFYRLKMVDVDASFNYSPVVKIDLGKKYTVTVYPNPAKGILYVQGMRNYRTADILDANGRLIKRQIISGKEFLNIETLKAGIYWIRLSGKDDIQNLQFIKE